jgi:hypothetical protein
MGRPGFEPGCGEMRQAFYTLLLLQGGIGLAVAAEAWRTWVVTYRHLNVVLRQFVWLSANATVLAFVNVVNAARQLAAGPRASLGEGLAVRVAAPRRTQPKASAVRGPRYTGPALRVLVV